MALSDILRKGIVTSTFLIGLVGPTYNTIDNKLEFQRAEAREIRIVDSDKLYLELSLNERLKYDEATKISANKKYDEATKILKELLLNNNSPLFFYMLGHINRFQDNLPEAIFYFKKAISFEPNYIDAHGILSKVYFEFEDCKNAIIEAETFLRLAPDHKNAEVKRQYIQECKQKS